MTTPESRTVEGRLAIAMAQADGFAGDEWGKHPSQLEEARKLLAVAKEHGLVIGEGELLDYDATWREFEAYEAKAAKQGSGMTREQKTGASMMLGWLVNKIARREVPA